MKCRSNLFVGLAIVVVWGSEPGLGFAQTKAATPDAAIKAFKTAIETGDMKAVAAYTAGESGTTLRKLAEPVTKAKAASDRLDKAIQAKTIPYKNTFAAGLSPFAELQYDLVELVKENNKIAARIKYGPSGKQQEETVAVQNEEGGWRVGLPADLAKSLPRKDRVERHVQGLGKLAEVLNSVAVDVEDGKLTTKDAVTLRMVNAVEQAKLVELLR